MEDGFSTKKFLRFVANADGTANVFLTKEFADALDGDFQTAEMPSVGTTYAYGEQMMSVEGRKKVVFIDAPCAIEVLETVGFTDSDAEADYFTNGYDFAPLMKVRFAD